MEYMMNLSQKILTFIEKSGHKDIDDITFALANVMVSLAKTQDIPHNLLIDLINEINRKQNEYDRANSKGAN